MFTRLARLLDGTAQAEEVEKLTSATPVGPINPDLLRPREGFCVECQDQPRSLFCEQCQDDFCQVCFDSLHRKGNRSKHVNTTVAPVSLSPVNGGDHGEQVMGAPMEVDLRITDEQKISPEQEERAGANIVKSFAYEATYREDLDGMVSKDISPEEQRARGEWLLERCKFFPLRLSLKERKYMRLVENALDVSEYTDHVDILSWKSKSGRIQAQLKELCAILCGLVIACDYNEGQKLLADKNFEQNEKFFQFVFEITRRHKIRNPEKLRDVYGKLVHVLMDAQNPTIVDLMGFKCVSNLKTVHSFLKDNDALDLLIEDYALIMDATTEIDSVGKPRKLLDKELRARDDAFKQLMKKYVGRTAEFTEDNLETVFRSIGDNHNYLRWNRDPVDRMIANLQKYFHPSKVESKYSLEIRSGRGGARLSHSHEVQYHYVLQSMTLWREILNEVF